MIQPDESYKGGTAILTAEELAMLLDVAELVSNLKIDYITAGALAKLNEEVDNDT
jgi:hypothetical protein